MNNPLRLVGRTLNSDMHKLHFGSCSTNLAFLFRVTTSGVDSNAGKPTERELVVNSSALMRFGQSI